MFAALCLLRVTPPVDAALCELCESELEVTLAFDNTTAPPSCHRSSLSPSVFCVAPSGFPALPVLGLALSGLDPEDFFAYLVSHPASGFLGSGSWVLSPEDVALLGPAGVSCRASALEPSPSPVSPVAVACVVVGSVGAVVGVACLVAALLSRRELNRNSLLDSIPSSVYT